MRKNFTLIELLVVISIMVILMALLFVSGRKFLQKGRISKTRIAMSSIRTATLSYKKDYGVYPHPDNTVEIVPGKPNKVVAPNADKTPLTIDGSVTGDFLKILSANNDDHNQRKINFLPKNYSFQSIWYTGNSYAGYAIIVACDNNLDGTIDENFVGNYGASSGIDYASQGCVVFSKHPEDNAIGNIISW